MEKMGANRFRKMKGGGPPPRLQPSRQRGVRSSRPNTKGRQRQTPRSTSCYPLGGEVEADNNGGDRWSADGGGGCVSGSVIV